MSFSGRSVAALVGVVTLVSGCGGAKIDATNSDTLKTSLLELSEKMTEEERASFGQDLYLMYRTAETGGVSELGPGDLYTASGRNVAIGQGFGVESVYLTLASRAREDLDGLTPAALNKVADKTRKEAYADMADRLEAGRENYQQAIDRIDPTIERLERELEALKAKNEEILAKAASTVTNPTYANVELKSRVLHLTGQVDVQNTFDDPIESVTFNVRSPLADNPDVYLDYKATVKFDPALEPGGSQQAAEFKHFASSRRAFKTDSDSKQEFSVSDGAEFGDTTITLISARALNDCEGYCAKYKTLTHQAIADNQQFSSRRSSMVMPRGRGIANEIEVCNGLKTNLERVIGEFDPLISEAKKLAKKPAPTELSMPSLPRNVPQSCG